MLPSVSLSVESPESWGFPQRRAAVKSVDSPDVCLCWVTQKHGSHGYILPSSHCSKWNPLGDGEIRRPASTIRIQATHQWSSASAEAVLWAIGGLQLALGDVALGTVAVGGRSVTVSPWRLPHCKGPRREHIQSGIKVSWWGYVLFVIGYGIVEKCVQLIC